MTVERSLAMLDRLLDVFGDRAFLVGGGLLGLVRDGGLIEDDVDLDMALHLRDWDESFLYRLRRAGIGLRVVRRWGRPGTWPWASRYVGTGVAGKPFIVKVKHGSWTGDVYVYAPGVGVHRSRVYMARGQAMVYRPAVTVEETVPATLHGRSIRIPKRADDLLSHSYGDWRTRVPGPWEGSPGWERLAKARWIYKDTPTRVFTSGVFDVLHRGHVRFIERAKALGDHLTVGVLAETDKDVVQSAEERQAAVQALGIADAVPIVGKLDMAFLEAEVPNVLAYGPEWDRPGIRRRAATLGITVETLPRTPGVSSTQIRGSLRV